MKLRKFLQFLGLAPAAPLVAKIPAVQAAVAAVAPAVVAASPFISHEYEWGMTCSTGPDSVNPSPWSTGITDFDGK
jgi:hypothetical protein